MPKAKRMRRNVHAPKVEMVDNDTDDSLPTPPQSNSSNNNTFNANTNSDQREDLPTFYRFLLERIEHQATSNKDVSCARLLALPRLRELQIRPNWPYNFSFRSRTNLSAALVQTRGRVLQGDERCARCKAGRGIFPHCVVFEDVHKGACGCCSYSCGASNCSFRHSRDLAANAITEATVPVPARADPVVLGAPTPTAVAAGTPAFSRPTNIVKANIDLNPTFNRIGERMSLRVNERQYAQSISRPQASKDNKNIIGSGASASRSGGQRSAFIANTTAMRVAKMEALGANDSQNNNAVSTPTAGGGGSEAGGGQTNMTKVYMRLASAIQDMKRMYTKQMAEIDSSMEVLRRLAQEK